MRARPLLLGALAPLVVACAAPFGALAAGTAVTAGGLALECPSHVLVTIRDPQTGDTLCEETIVAIRGDERHEFPSCVYAALPDGSWTLRPERTDLEVGQSQIVIQPEPGCERSVYSVEL
jgi:hypothetical protein